MVDVDWVRRQFEELTRLLERVRVPPPAGLISTGSYRFTNSTPSERQGQGQVVERVLDACLPEWRQFSISRHDDEWQRHRQAMPRCLTLLERQDEIETALGPVGPKLSASELHPWVWNAAKLLWDDGHYRKAVEAAGQAVNVQTQAKVGTNDLSEATLFEQAFSDDEPGSNARLRLPDDDGGRTAKSVRRGIRSYATGCYAGIRNPVTHGDPMVEIPDNEALEMLASFSVLARWVDGADVRRAG
jgi:hypothetical protein